MNKILGMDTIMKKRAKVTTLKDTLVKMTKMITTEVKPSTVRTFSQSSNEDCHFSSEADLLMFKSALNLVSRLRTTLKVMKMALEKM